MIASASHYQSKAMMFISIFIIVLTSALLFVFMGYRWGRGDERRLNQKER